MGMEPGEEQEIPCGFGVPWMKSKGGQHVVLGVRVCNEKGIERCTCTFAQHRTLLDGVLEQPASCNWVDF